jgi:hypothetical protein
MHKENDSKGCISTADSADNADRLMVLLEHKNGCPGGAVVNRPGSATKERSPGICHAINVGPGWGLGIS